MGPGYCKTCRKTRDSEAACGECPEPQLLPENDIAVNVFCGCQTQWRHAGMGQRTGLDYTGVESVMRMMNIDDTHDTLARIQIMERELLSIDADKAKTRGDNHGA